MAVNTALHDVNFALHYEVHVFKQAIHLQCTRADMKGTGSPPFAAPHDHSTTYLAISDIACCFFMHSAVQVVTGPSQAACETAPCAAH